VSRRAVPYVLVLSLAACLALIWGPGTAAAATAVEGVAPPLAAPESLMVPPPGFRTTARQALAAGERTQAVRDLRRRHRDLRAQPYVWDGWRWELDYVAGDRLLAEVDVGPDGRVLAVFTGPQAASYLARGHHAGKFASPWVFLPFAVLFLVPFVDLRRPGRLLHLDLLVLLSFGISYWFFHRGDVLTSVPLVYPVLAYLLGRALWAGLRPRRRPGPLVPHLPVAVLAVGLVLLTGARVALNLADDRVIDVGYASVVGADRIAHKLPLYVENETHGDTYGPVNYLAYAPFERVLPWHGTWDDLPAAHAATIAFDLLTIVGLVLLGMRLRAGREGRRLGLALGWAWAAFPFTLLGAMLNTNDGLVALLLVCALLGLASPAARGAMLGLAAAAKFVPAALAPLFARGLDGRVTWRHAGVFTAVFALVVALPILLYLPDGGAREFYDTTIGFQLGRDSVFSPWGLHPDTAWLGTLQTLLEVGAVALAVLVVVFPRGPRTPGQVAALGAAVLIAVQLPAAHWFYFYVVWFTPFLLVALFSEHSDDAPAAVVAEPERAPERVPVAA
jgi:Glycosyltransferase family 87